MAGHHGQPVILPWWRCTTDSLSGLEIRAGQVYESRIDDESTKYEDDRGNKMTRKVKIVFRVDTVLLTKPTGISIEATFIKYDNDDDCMVNSRACLHICGHAKCPHTAECQAEDLLGMDGYEPIHLKMVRLIEEYPREKEDPILQPAAAEGCEEHKKLAREYRALASQLHATEHSIFQQERNYLEDSTNCVAVRGLESFMMNTRFTQTPRGRQTRIKDKDRIFSLSSVTGTFADERLPSPTSSPAMKKPKPHGKHK